MKILSKKMLLLLFRWHGCMPSPLNMQRPQHCKMHGPAAHAVKQAVRDLLLISLNHFQAFWVREEVQVISLKGAE